MEMIYIFQGISYLDIYVHRGHAKNNCFKQEKNHYKIINLQNPQYQRTWHGKKLI